MWSAPALLTLAVLARHGRSRPALVAGALGLLVFVSSPQWWFPSGAERELRWAMWQQVTGSSYVVYAALLLGLAAAGNLTRRAGSGQAQDPFGVDAQHPVERVAG